VLQEWSKIKGLAPELEPSAHWNIRDGFNTGKSVPDYSGPGCYVFYSADGTLWYVGKTDLLGRRMTEYFYADATPKGNHKAEYVTLQTIKTASLREAEELEHFIYLQLVPPGNQITPAG
jgi:excinuclease UvrABC nuclease subunit